MRLALYVRQSEVGRAERSERLALVSPQPEVPGIGDLIVRRGLMHKLGKGREIE